MAKPAWIVAVVLATGCTSKTESSPADRGGADRGAAPAPAPKPAPLIAATVEQRAATAIARYFEILAAFTTAFNAGAGCDDKRQRATAALAGATKQRDEVAALFRDRDVVERAGPTMIRPSEDDPNYEVRMHAFGIFVEGSRASCDLEGELHGFLEPIWKAAHDAGWEYDPDRRAKELLEAKP